MLSFLWTAVVFVPRGWPVDENTNGKRVTKESITAKCRQIKQFSLQCNRPLRYLCLSLHKTRKHGKWDIKSVVMIFVSRDTQEACFTLLVYLFVFFNSWRVELLFVASVGSKWTQHQSFHFITDPCLLLSTVNSMAWLTYRICILL